MSSGLPSVIPICSHSVNTIPGIDIDVILCFTPIRLSKLVSYRKTQNPATKLQGLCLIVEPEGFEPSSKRATKMLSTYLVFV